MQTEVTFAIFVLLLCQRNRLIPNELRTSRFYNALEDRTFLCCYFVFRILCSFWSLHPQTNMP